MKNTRKLLTSMAVLVTLSAEAMQRTPWEAEIEAEKEPPEDSLTQLLENSNADKPMSRFVPALFGGVNLDRPADICDRSLKDLIFGEGKIFTAQALVAANMLNVSVPELVQCVLAVNDERWSGYDFLETAARLIALVAKQQGIDPRAILAEIKQQADQNLQQRRSLIRCFDNRIGNDFNFEKILKEHGF